MLASSAWGEDLIFGIAWNIADGNQRKLEGISDCIDGVVKLS